MRKNTTTYTLKKRLGENREDFIARAKALADKIPGYIVIAPYSEANTLSVLPPDNTKGLGLFVTVYIPPR
jgi:hypothetical protein